MMQFINSYVRTRGSIVVWFPLTVQRYWHCRQETTWLLLSGSFPEGWEIWTCCMLRTPAWLHITWWQQTGLRGCDGCQLYEGNCWPAITSVSWRGKVMTSCDGQSYGAFVRIDQLTWPIPLVYNAFLHLILSLWGFVSPCGPKPTTSYELICTRICNHQFPNLHLLWTYPSGLSLAGRLADNYRHYDVSWTVVSYRLLAFD